MEVKRHSLYHDASDGLFEVITTKEAEECLNIGCDDVTGNEVWEKRFKSQTLFNEFIRNDNPSDKLMKEFICETHELMREDDVTTLNGMMLLPNEKSSKLVFVFFLRTTCTFKDRLPNWFVLRDNAVKWLTARGEKPESTLHGLL